MAVEDDLSNLNTVLSAVVVPVGSQPIRRIYNNVTEKLPTTAELPCYVIRWGKPIKSNMMTFGGTVREQREYVLRFLYKPVGQGTLNDNLVEILAYQQPTLNALYARIFLFSTVLAQYPVSCGMPIEFSDDWAGQKHQGFDTVITVIEQVKVNFGS